jgi:hypothetical protein
VPLKRKSEVDLTKLVDLTNEDDVTNEDDDSVQITRTITNPHPIPQPIPVCLGMINTFLLESSSSIYEFDKNAKQIDNWYNLKVAITHSSTKNCSNLYFYHLNGKLVGLSDCRLGMIITSIKAVNVTAWVMIIPVIITS